MKCIIAPTAVREWSRHPAVAEKVDVEKVGDASMLKTYGGVEASGSSPH